MKDLTERKAVYLDDAIEAINEYFARIGKLKRGGLTIEERAIHLDTVDAIKALPSAQQETDWIPVTKKAHPDKEGKYLVTDDAGGMADSTWDEFIFCDDGTPSWMYSQNVTAWKPFPEPWRGEE